MEFIADIRDIVRHSIIFIEMSIRALVNNLAMEDESFQHYTAPIICMR